MSINKYTLGSISLWFGGFLIGVAVGIVIASQPVGASSDSCSERGSDRRDCTERSVNKWSK